MVKRMENKLFKKSYKNIQITIFMIIMFIILSVIGCDEDKPSPTSSPVIRIVPDGALWTGQDVTTGHHNITPPIENFRAVLGWLQTVTISPYQNPGETAIVTVDYIRLIGYMKINSKIIPQIVIEDNYDRPFPRSLNQEEGKLYNRLPRWFAGEVYEYKDVFNSQIQDGFLTIDVAKTPDKIVHWWTPRIYIDPNAQYYLMQIRFKIDGKAAIQIGSDWWKDINSPYLGYGINNIEAWISDWYGNTNGNFVEITVPIL